ncbi:hypothetical protein FHG87_024130 [Trinorchestia longiramus]|nr:hypothetical protein FHG87_024130 [Trinorchestia longiramus]
MPVQWWCGVWVVLWVGVWVVQYGWCSGAVGVVQWGSISWRQGQSPDGLLKSRKFAAKSQDGVTEADKVVPLQKTSPTSDRTQSDQPSPDGGADDAKDAYRKAFTGYNADDVPFGSATEFNDDGDFDEDDEEDDEEEEEYYDDEEEDEDEEDEDEEGGTDQGAVTEGSSMTILTPGGAAGPQLDRQPFASK